MRRLSDKMNTTLILLMAVAVLMALLLFLDVFIPVFPTSFDRPDREAGESGTGSGAETKKHWWEGIFGRDEPKESDVPDTEESTMSLDTDSPSTGWEDLHWEFPHYTEEELIGLFKNSLEYALILFAEKEAAGEIPPIDRVGLFDLDQDGVPEVITMGVYDGSVEYHAYGLYNIKNLSSWGWEGTQYGELSLWLSPFLDASSSSISIPSSRRAFMTHTGDGDDEYLYEFNSKMECEERYAKAIVQPFQNSSVVMRFFRLNGQTVDEKEYTESYDRFIHTNFRIPETTMATVQWNASDPEGLAEQLLTSGQWFLYDGKW